VTAAISDLLSNRIQSFNNGRISWDQP